MPAAHPASAWPVPDYAASIAPALRHPEARQLLPGVLTYTDVIYKTELGWRPLRADIHVPKSASEPVPVVVYAHGGSFIGGTRQLGPWTTLPSSGIAVVSIDYRLSGECDFPVPVEDYRDAVRWVRRNAARYGLDRRRVSGWGTSAGAYLAGMAALAEGRPPPTAGPGPAGADPMDEARLASVVLHAPTTDFSLLREDADGASDSALADLEVVASAFLGADPYGPRAVQASMLGAAERAATPPPFLVVHGDQDRRVGIGQSRRLLRALQLAGGDAVLHELHGADHMSEAFAHPDTTRLATEFLRQTWRAVGSRTDRDAAEQDPTDRPSHDAHSIRASGRRPQGRESHDRHH